MRFPFGCGAAVALTFVACDRNNPVEPLAVPTHPSALIVGPAALSQVSAGGWHTCVIKNDGALACWGALGQDMVPVDLGAVTQVSAGTWNVCAVKSDGTLACWGDDSHGQATVAADLGPVTQVSEGGALTCAIKSDGALVCWGWNDFGQADVPEDLGPVTQVSAGENWHACAIKTGGALVCWGSSAYGQATVPADLGAVTEVSAGGWHTCAVKADGTVACWGRGDNGAVTVPIGLGAVTHVAAGYDHTCAIKSSGALACWGDNSYGQATVPENLGAVTQVSAGAWHTCALRVDRTLACWGLDDRGQSSVPVAHILPVASFTAPTSVTEGAPIELTLADAQVPGYDGGPFTYFFDCGDGAGYVDHGATTTVSCATSDNGTRTVRGLVRDRDGDQAEYSATVTIENVAPTFGRWLRPTDVPMVCRASGACRAGSFMDPGTADTWTLTVDYGDGTGVQPLSFYPGPGGGSIGLGHEYAAQGTYTVVVTVTDDDGGSAQSTLEVGVPDQNYTPPGRDVVVRPVVDGNAVVMAPVDLMFGEVTTGGMTTVSTGTVGGGQGDPPAPSASNFRLGTPPVYYDITTTAVFTPPVRVCIWWAQGDHGTDAQESQLRLLHWTVSGWEDITIRPDYPDVANNGICGLSNSLSAFLVAEQNLPPVVSVIVLPGAPVPVGTVAAMSAAFSDANPGDTHAATVAWGDGSTSPGTVSESNGAGTVSNSHTYSTAGVYGVTVTVKETDTPNAGSRSSTLDIPAYVVVYDANAGFVTGGGWTVSPVGACRVATVCAADVTGKATFGFVAKYQKGATAPSGTTEFQLHAGGLNFKSVSYDWLVVTQSGTNAQFKGTGTINGAGSYRFMIWAGDGTGADGSDTFRIRIWTETGGVQATVYDSDSDQPITGGSIVIRRR